MSLLEQLTAGELDELTELLAAKLGVALVPRMAEVAGEMVKQQQDRGLRPATVLASTSAANAPVNVLPDDALDTGAAVDVQNLTGLALYVTQRVMLLDQPEGGTFVVGLISDPASFLSLPIGAAMPWTHKTLPPGGAWEVGQAVSRTTYPRLNAFYSTDGYVYGVGDGATTFNLRDMRGRGHVGLDDMGGAAADAGVLASANTLGLAIGAELRTLLATESGFPGSAHAGLDPTHRHLVFAVSDTVATGAQVRSRATTGGSNFNSDFAATGMLAHPAANAAAAHNMMNPGRMGLWVVRIG